MKIGAKIKEERLKSGISKYRVSKDCGITFNTLSALEEDRHSIRMDIVTKVCDYLGLTIKVERV